MAGSILFDIESYRTRFLGGARAYLFYVFFTIPGTTGASESSGIIGIVKSALSTFGLGAEQDKIPYLVRATSLPEASLEEVRTPLTEFDIRTPGIPTYGDWTVSLHVDEKGEILEKFYGWFYLCQSGLPRDYMKQQEIYLLDYSGSSMFKYMLYGAWPKHIGAVSLDYSSNDIASVDITFAYQYHVIESISSGTASIIKNAANRISGLIK